MISRALFFQRVNTPFPSPSAWRKASFFREYDRKYVRYVLGEIHSSFIVENINELQSKWSAALLS